MKPGRVGVRSKPTSPLHPSSTQPQSHHMNSDESIPLPRALFTVCAAKGSGALTVGKERLWVQAMSCVHDV